MNCVTADTPWLFISHDYSSRDLFYGLPDDRSNLVCVCHLAHHRSTYVLDDLSDSTYQRSHMPVHCKILAVA